MYKVEGLLVSTQSCQLHAQSYCSSGSVEKILFFTTKIPRIWIGLLTSSYSHPPPKKKKTPKDHLAMEMQCCRPSLGY